MGCRASERGNALILVLVAVVVLGFLAAGAFAIIRETHDAARVDLQLRSQTLNVAESGITEALSWFRQQRQQPVRTFDAAVYAAPGTPPGSGIIREFDVSAGTLVYGRYEVLPDRVVDVTAARGRGPEGSGTVWEVTSVGYLFVRNDPKKPFDQAPNQVLHRLAVSTELQRLAVRPPARAALLSNRADTVVVEPGGRVRGTNGAAVVYKAQTGRARVDARAEVSSESGAPLMPAPNRPQLPPFELDELSVFGVRPSELRDLSDVVVASVDELPERMPQLAIVYIDGDATFDESRPLEGGGVLYVAGDLTIAPQSNSSYFGAVYVAGNLTMDAPSVISGTVIVRGTTDIRGRGDISEVTFNEDILTVVRRQLGQYRVRRAMTRVVVPQKGAS